MKTLNLTKLAEYIGINKRTLYRMIKDGRFPVEPVKGVQPKRWYIKDVDSWLEGKK